MKKLFWGLCFGTLLILGGCKVDNGISNLENASGADVVQQEIGSVVLAGSEEARSMTAYVTNQKNAEVYTLSNAEVQNFVSMVKDVHVMEKNADTADAFKNKITLNVYRESEYGYDEICSFAEADGDLYMVKGWNEEGEFIYYKLRSEKLSEWIASLKKATSSIINEEEW